MEQRPPSECSVVWFKRDLRLHDHAALMSARMRGPVLCLYVIEPSLWRAPDAAGRHYAFLLDCLRDLYKAIRQRGGMLHVVTGEVVDVLTRLHAALPFSALFSHEETGNALTYQRDIAVGKWCAAHGVTWQEPPQFGVVRRLKNRDRWQGLWEAHMAQLCLPAPERIDCLPLPWPEPAPLSAQELGLVHDDPPGRQRGGRREGVAVLEEFLAERSRQYRGGISSPLSAPTACSRLSPYLALGCLSMREVVQAARLQAALPQTQSYHKAGITAFVSRLYWHCHFIQKLESEPALEWRNLHRGYDGMREHDWREAHFQALVAARTGWPLVDACVVMLRETGWLNFRMRAMLVSVAAYPLWLHWREVGLWLARQFVDYEPGIHWSQLQMQSGTTGINIPRIYNPIKQARDHDPRGSFVRRWLPSMRKVPDTWLFEPWRMPPEHQARCGLQPGEIAQPLVDLEQATREAKAKLHGVRARPEVKAGKAAIIEKHGSRKRGEGRAGKRAATGGTAQMTLEF